MQVDSQPDHVRISQFLYNLYEDAQVSHDVAANGNASGNGSGF